MNAQPLPPPCRVLIVEDEALIAEDLADQLRRAGYEVCGQVGSGRLALAAARDQRPGVVLMDVQLQGELDGIETARELRLHHDVPVLFLTAYSDVDTVRRIEESDAYGYLLKPFHPRQLVASIELACRRHRSSGQVRADEAVWRAALHQLPAALFLADGAGRVLLVNGDGERLTGWTEAEALGRSIRDVVGLRPPPNAPAGVLTRRLRLRARDGRERLVDARLAGLLREGAPLGLIALVWPADEAAAPVTPNLQLDGAAAVLGARTADPGYVTLCSWTKHLSLDRIEWMPLERFFYDHLGLQVTHGISPAAVRRFFPEVGT